MYAYNSQTVWVLRDRIPVSLSRIPVSRVPIRVIASVVTAKAEAKRDREGSVRPVSPVCAALMGISRSELRCLVPWRAA